MDIVRQIEKLERKVAELRKEMLKSISGDQEVFELKREHLILLNNCYVGWSYCETGAPEINPKRPYGNSYVSADVCELLGLDLGDNEEYAMQLHEETKTALSIVLNAMTFETGLYRNDSKYSLPKWVKIG